MILRQLSSLPHFVKSALKNSVSPNSSIKNASILTVNHALFNNLWNVHQTNKNTFFNVQSRFSSSKIINVPPMGDSITEGTLGEWKKNVGEFVNVDELVAIIETDKISVDINSPEKGTLISQKANAGDVVFVGNPLYELDTNATEGSGASSGVTPAADSAEVKPKESEEVKQTSNEASSETKSDSNRVDAKVPLTRLRKKIAERLKTAQNSAASLTTFNEVDMGEIMAYRKKVMDEFTHKHGIKFGFVSVFLYASSRALMEMPQMNAYITEKGDELITKNYADISVAVATPTGLLVPVLRDADKKNLPQLEASLAELAKRAREGKIGLEDMQGGTFTISNGGVFGSLIGTPILNYPQASILGLHAIKDRAVVVKGVVVPRPMMYLALTYDHRMIDGREGVTFLNRIKEIVEDPKLIDFDL